MNYLHVYALNILSVNIQYEKMQVSKLVRFLIYLDNNVMQLSFLIPLQDKKKLL